jgi:polar amino acid transport system permease protein
VIERATIMRGRSPTFQVYALMLLVYFVICSSLSALSRYF